MTEEEREKARRDKLRKLGIPEADENLEPGPSPTPSPSPTPKPRTTLYSLGQKLFGKDKTADEEKKGRQKAIGDLASR